MRARWPEPDLSTLHAYLEEAQTRRCCLCGDGASARCGGGRDAGKRLVVAARGNHSDVALVPVFADERARVGCPDLRSLVLLRHEAFSAEDRALAAAVEDAGGRLRTVSSFAAEGVHTVLAGAAMVLSWVACDVFASVDAAANRGRRRPVLVVADPRAPDYGRWPVPATPWKSIESLIAWDREPFQVCTRLCYGGRPLDDAVAAGGLPAIAEADHPLTEALALAALLRTVCLERPDALRLTLESPTLVVAGICRGQVSGLDVDEWKPVFVGDGSDAGVTLLEIELAYAHARMALEARARDRQISLVEVGGGDAK